MVLKLVERQASQPASATRLVDYLRSAAQHPGEILDPARISNCSTETDVELAVAELRATAARNTRATGDRTAHLIVAFSADERPTADQLGHIEDRLLAAIGLADHQRVSQVHRGDGSTHLHIAVSRIDPRTYRCVRPRGEYRVLAQERTRLTAELGLVPLPERRREVAIPVGAKNLEAHSGEQSFASWVADRRDGIVAVGKAAESWEAFHVGLAELGVEVHKRGAGLVLRPVGASTNDRAALKLSSVDRALSAGALTARLGAFHGPSAPARKIGPRYERTPRQNPMGDAFKALRESYQTARALRETELRRRRTEIRDGALKARDVLRSSQHPIREVIYRATHMTRTTRRIELAKLDRIMAEQLAHIEDGRRRQLAALPRQVTWLGYLQAEAATNPAALTLIRSAERRTIKVETALVSATTPEQARDAILVGGSTPKISKRGDAVYTLPDGGRLRDVGEGVQVSTESPAAWAAAIRLAQLKYPGAQLEAHGSVEFVAAFRVQLARYAPQQGRTHEDRTTGISR